MDIIKAYTFIIDEENWITKILIGAVVVFFAFLIVPIFLLFGYQVAVARNVKDGNKELMPSWGEDLGKMFIDGVIVWVAYLLYALPLILLVICTSLLILPAAFAADTFDPFAAATAALAGSAALFCIGLLYAIFLIVVLPAVVIQYVRTDEFGPMFQVREVLGVARDNFVDILIAVVSGIVASFVFGLLAIIPICGWLIVAFVVPVWTQVSMGHLYGQIAAKIEGKPFDMAYAE